MARRHPAPAATSAAHLGVRHLWGKDEGQNPTGSFKARGLGMAMTRARTLGARGFIIPSAGNAGGAAAVDGARAGLPVAVIVPRGTPPAALAEALIAGAHVFTIEGSIATAGKVVGRVGIRDRLVRSVHVEGALSSGRQEDHGSGAGQQLDWAMPDVLLYPTGGGTGLVGIPKGYEELRTMGWIRGVLPRFYAVQAEGCAPVVKAFLDGKETTTPWENPLTHAVGLRVPSPFAGRQMLKVLRDSGSGRRHRAGHRGRSAPSGTARRYLDGAGRGGPGGGARSAQGPGRDQGEARIVLVLTGTGIKYDPPRFPFRSISQALMTTSRPR